MEWPLRHLFVLIGIMFGQQLDTVGTLLLALVCLLLGRQLVKTGYIRNPFDSGARDFRVGPILRDVSWCAACFGGGLVWALLVTLAVKHRVLPDSYWTGYGLLLVPILGFLAASALFLGRALITTMFGRAK